VHHNTTNIRKKEMLDRLSLPHNIDANRIHWPVQNEKYMQNKEQYKFGKLFSKSKR
jgi:hypothetical protein